MTRRKEADDDVGRGYNTASAWLDERETWEAVQGVAELAAAHVTAEMHASGELPEHLVIAYDTTERIEAGMVRPAHVVECPVQTKEYDWGNYCPNDPDGLGVHHCILPGQHRRTSPNGELLVEPTREVPAPGHVDAQWCRCTCGTQREPDRPKRNTGA